jgi:methyl-accepting chemotaxis protein
MIQQIASASEQQSATAEELSISVDGVASISATSASEAQKSAHAAEQLVEQAHELNKIVSSFKLTM